MRQIFRSIDAPTANIGRDIRTTARTQSGFEEWLGRHMKDAQLRQCDLLLEFLQDEPLQAMPFQGVTFGTFGMSTLPCFGIPIEKHTFVTANWANKAQPLRLVKQKKSNSGLDS